MSSMSTLMELRSRFMASIRCLTDFILWTRSTERDWWMPTSMCSILRGLTVMSSLSTIQMVWNLFFRDSSKLVKNLHIQPSFWQDIRMGECLMCLSFVSLDWQHARHNLDDIRAGIDQKENMLIQGIGSSLSRQVWEILQGWPIGSMPSLKWSRYHSRIACFLTSQNILIL